MSGCRRPGNPASGSYRLRSRVVGAGRDPGRPGHRAAVGRPALGQPPPPGQWPGCGAGRGVPQRAPVPVAEIDSGAIAVAVNTVPLAQVETAWIQPAPPGARTVLVP